MLLIPEILLKDRVAVSGLSKQVIQNRDEAIRSQVESFAPNKEKYTLVAKVVNVGVALLVYVLDEKLGDKVSDVQTQWTGTGPGWMGNKGAVGVRFRLKGKQNKGAGEIFTYVPLFLPWFLPESRVLRLAFIDLCALT